MEDSSIDSGGETESSQGDLAVDVDTLVIDGVRPKAGDPVDLKVSGTIRKLVDNTAFITPTTINDQPMPEKPQATEEEDLMAKANELDSMAAPYA